MNISKKDLIIMVVVIGIGAAVLIYSGLFVDYSLGTNTIKHALNKENIQKQERDDASWKTYTDEENGFEIKYPDNYNLTSDEYKGERTITFLGQEFQIIVNVMPDKKYLVDSNSNDVCPIKVFKTPAFPVLDVKEINISNGSLKICKQQTSDVTGFSASILKNVDKKTNQGNYFYVYGMINNKYADQGSDLFVKIVSTLKLLK